MTETDRTKAKELLLKADLDAEYVVDTSYKHYEKDVPEPKISKFEYEWLRDYISEYLYEYLEAQREYALDNFLK